MSEKKIDSFEPSSARLFYPIGSDIVCVKRSGSLHYRPACPLHNHDGYELLLILAGEANYYVETEGQILGAGELILNPAYSFHCANTEGLDSFDRIILNFKESYLKKLCTEQTDLHACFERISESRLNHLYLKPDEVHYFSLLTKRLTQILEHPSYGAELLTASLMIQILLFVNQKALDFPIPDAPETILPKIVSDTIDYINEHLSDDLSMMVLTEHLNHSSDYIGRRFRKVMGTTLQQFIIAKRITLAQKYLRERRTVTDACMLSGFSDYSNFSRCFSKHVGLSPREYQKRNVGL